MGGAFPSSCGCTCDQATSQDLQPLVPSRWTGVGRRLQDPGADDCGAVWGAGDAGAAGGPGRGDGWPGKPGLILALVNDDAVGTWEAVGVAAAFGSPLGLALCGPRARVRGASQRLHCSVQDLGVRLSGCSCEAHGGAQGPLRPSTQGSGLGVGSNTAVPASLRAPRTPACPLQGQPRPGGLDAAPAPRACGAPPLPRPKRGQRSRSPCFLVILRQHWEVGRQLQVRLL